MPVELAVLVPSRGRPENIRRLIGAWDFTNAWDVADLIVIADSDDPEIGAYRSIWAEDDALPGRLIEMATWMPMVHKLNLVAKDVAEGWGTEEPPFALGFAGDDHVPQTISWAKRYLAVLHELGSGMVFGDDGYQGSNLSTEWAVTADAVRALGRMVPAPVEHMYCDNSMMDLFGGAGALVHLPEVRIEHMHPIANKAPTDEQYKRVNHRDQFRVDKRSYDSWRGNGMLRNIAAVRALRPGLPDVRPTKAMASKLRPGSTPRAVPQRPRGNTPMRKLPIPRHFRRVRGATPDEIGLTLADFSTQVPKDQAIVELGVYQGRTALMMAWGARQGLGARVWGFDAWDLEGNTYGPPFSEAGSETWARYNVMAQGFNNSITLVKSFAADGAAGWSGPPVGLLFVDDDHSAEGARSAIELWAPHLAEGALIAVDDYGHPDWPGVAEAVDALVDEGVLEPVEIFHDRLAVTRLVTDPAQTPDEIPHEEGMARPVLHPFEGDEVECTLCGRTADLHLDTEVSTTTAITSEGVSPAPYPAAEDQVAVPPIEGGTVAIGEAETVSFADGLETKTLGQLRALAKNRNIVLGRRKDLKADIIQALREGK
jgi:hypothetical protein